MAKKQLDKLVANEINSLVEYQLKREHLLLEFLMKDSAIDVAPSAVTLLNGDSIPVLNSSQNISTPRSINWIQTVITNGRLISIGGAEIRTDLSIANRNASTLDIVSSSGDDVTVPAVTNTLAGLMTAAQSLKLSGIEANADVTDKENVGAAIISSPTKTSLADNDYIAIIDSSGNILSKIIWSSVNLDRGYTVNQVAHGFSVGDPVKPTGTGWILTQADSKNNAGTVGVVSEVVNANTFKYIVDGVIPGGYILGANYFLSTSIAGDLMVVDGTETWLQGQVIEYIGTGVTGGLHVQIGVGQEISDLVIVDKYVSAVTFDNDTRVLTLERTDGLDPLTTVIPQYVEVDTLQSVTSRGSTTTTGATFGGTVMATILAVDYEYTITKSSNKLVLSAPYQADFVINNLTALQIAAGGNITAAGTITAQSIKLVTGATPDYVWKCTNTNGSGVWAPIAASNVYKGTWDASTNTPTLQDGIGTAGWYYRVTVPGTWNGITFFVGDDVIYNGSIWEKIPGTSYALQPATATVLGGVKIGSGVSVTVDGTISVSTNYQAPLNGTGLVYSTAGVISYDTTVYASQFWVSTNFATIGHTHANYVPTTRLISTAGSLTGGGNLSADRTLSLVNDNTTPGNNYLYGTNSSGVKGWYQRFWVPATNGIAYTGGWVGIGVNNPLTPLYVSIAAPSLFTTIINNTDNVTGNGLLISAGDIAFEVRDKDNYINPVFQIFGNGAIKWQLPSSGTSTKLIYYNPTTYQLSAGDVPTLASLGGISLTSLSATSPIQYDNTTGIFSMIANAYAPYGTVSFPGFGTTHTTAAYGDHTHTISEIVWSAGLTTQYWRGDKTWQTLDTLAVTENTNLYFTTARSRTSISLTTTGSSGAATYNSTTGVFNIPNYGAAVYLTGASFSSGTGVLTFTRSNTTDLTIGLDGRYSLLGHTHAYEPTLGTPLVDGYLLSSTVAGVRSWVAPYSHPTYTVRSIDATTGQVIDTFSSDSTGHVTGITLRSLVEADIPALPISKITDLASQLSQKQPLDGDLTAIASIAAGVGFLKRTGIETWVIDTNTYLTGITGLMVTNALGFTPEPYLGLPASSGYVLSSTTAGVRSWIPITGGSGGTVTSVAAGAGMNFTTITGAGTVVLGTPSSITTASTNSASGTTHTHVLDLSGRSVNTQFSIAGGGSLGSNLTLYLVGDVASPAANYFYSTDGAGTRGWYAFPYPGAGLVVSTGSGWGSSIPNGAGFLKNNGAGVWSYDNSIYDRYLRWNVSVNGISPYPIDSQATLDFQQGSGISITKSNNIITIAATGGNGTVTSVGLSAPTGFSVSGSPVTGSGTLTLSFASGYSLPTTAKQTQWDSAYTNSGKVTLDGGVNYYALHSGSFFVDAGSVKINVADSVSIGEFKPITSNAVATVLQFYQPTLVSGTNIKTINGSSILGSGNLTISSSTTWGSITGTLSAQTDLQSALNGKAALNGSSSQDFLTSTLILGSSFSNGWSIQGGAGGSFAVFYNGSVKVSADSSGNVTAQEFYRGSSRLLKHNITDLSVNAIELLMNVDIVEYDMISDGSHAYGFIAEDTTQILSGKDQKGHVFGNHLAMLTRAIQQEFVEIEILKQRVNELESKIQELTYGR